MAIRVAAGLEDRLLPKAIEYGRRGTLNSEGVCFAKDLAETPKRADAISADPCTISGIRASNMRNLRKAWIGILMLLLVATVASAQTKEQRPILVQRNGHGGAIRSLAISQSGDLLASASDDNTIIVWNIPLQQEFLRITSHVAPVVAVAFCGPEPSLVSASDDGTAALWDLKKRKEITNIGGSIVPSSLAVSTDCRKIFVGNSHGPALLWEPLDGKKITVLKDVRGASTVALSTDGHYFAAASDDGDTWRCGTEPFSCTHANIGRDPIGIGFLPNEIPGAIWIATRSELLKWPVGQDPTQTIRGDPLAAVAPQYVNHQIYCIRARHIIAIDMGALARPVSRTLSESTLDRITTLAAVSQPSLMAIGNESGDIEIIDLARPPKRVRLTSPKGALSFLAASADNVQFSMNSGPLWQMSLRTGETSIIGQLLTSESFITYFNNTTDALVHVEGEGFRVVNLTSGSRWKVDPDSAAHDACAQEPFIGFLATSDGGSLYIGCRNGSVLKFSRQPNHFVATVWIDAARTGIRSLTGLFLADDERKMVLVGSSAASEHDIPTLFVNALLTRTEPKIDIAGRATSVELKTGAVSRQYDFHAPAPIIGATLSEDGKLLVALDQLVGEDVAVSVKWSLVLELSSGVTRILEGRANGVTDVAFTADSHTIVTGSKDGRVRFWPTDRPDAVIERTGHTGPVVHVAPIPHSSYVLSAGEDGHLVLWNASSGLEVLRIVRPGDPDRLTISPDGRFDSSQLETLSAVGWVFPDDPFTPLPPEIYMRDYYVPGLLSRLLAGEPFKPRPLEGLNRAQPSVCIEGNIITDPDGASISIPIRVASAPSRSQKDSLGAPLQSGVYDLRLFRDGQLVGQYPLDVEKHADVAENSLASWQSSHRILERGEQVVVLPHIRLPRRKSLAETVFTAYAFNRDRVKSETSPPVAYPLPSRLNDVSRRAYLITVGVNANESHWNLELAVPSAERARTLLRRKLENTYQEIVEITLNSELAPDSARVTVTRARKSYLEAVFKLLADKQSEVSDAVRQEIDPQHRLGTARPDDAVALYIASHGYADAEGRFYLIPYDTGTSWGITADVLARCQAGGEQSSTCSNARLFLGKTISSDELASWWRDVDAGELVMILDSCHSGAVTGRAFRPGPLGDPGFGQLSYDKGMRILVAAQSTQTAYGDWIGSPDGNTLLVGALDSIAANNPGLNIDEWLRAVEVQLPLDAQARYPELDRTTFQTPKLMDFMRRVRGVSSTHRDCNVAIH